jgi:hypothetical protein
MNGLIFLVLVSFIVVARAMRKPRFDPYLPDDWRPSRTVMRQQCRMKRILGEHE